ncbi:hypothetical protein [Levilactobacillus namurensis]|uniref:Uncharacterized protein n=1 Tax=Levilactobacillus namurensis TaxID=380393 RepID=A0AAW8W2H5_9LACO|nr:hypothetical protein [Levilactobacillus namurensis]MDT7012969.1 hypothetical protein [Levilactobacillus namurensis]
MLEKRSSENIFEWAIKQNLEDLRMTYENEKDPKKQSVYLALYNYSLAKKQEKLIARKRFVR